MKLKKIIITTLFIFAVFTLVFIIYNHNGLNKLDIQTISHSPIITQEDDRLFFYRGGFAISGEYVSFYDNKGQQVDMPFELDHEYDQDFVITDMTSNFMLINKNTLYKIDGMNLQQVYSLDTSAIRIKEYGNYLLLLVEGPGDGLSVKLLDVDNSVLSDLGFDESFYFMDLDCDNSDSYLSVLTLDIDGSFPSSKILHYDENLSLFGVTSAVDQVFYRVLRLPTRAILIGNRQLVCYNIEGDVEWRIENNHINGFQVVHSDSGILIYLGHNLEKDQQGEYYNGIHIDNQGERQNIKLPSQLTKISLYRDNRFFGLQYGKNILIFDEKGNVDQEYFVDEDINDIIWSPHHPQNFFILNHDGELQVYSIKQEDAL